MKLMMRHRGSGVFGIIDLIGLHGAPLEFGGGNLALINTATMARAGNLPGQRPRGVSDPEQRFISATSYQYPVTVYSIC